MGESGAHFILVALIVLVFIGLSMVKLQYLSFTSIFGLLAIAFTSIIIMKKAGTNGKVHEEVKLIGFQWKGLVSSTAIIAFAFACHHVSPTLYQQMEERTTK